MQERVGGRLGRRRMGQFAQDKCEHYTSGEFTDVCVPKERAADKWLSGGWRGR